MILSSSSSFFTTLLTVKLVELGVSNLTLGMFSSSYYMGFIIGAFSIERFILRVGHIRTYAAFASFIGIVALLHGLFFSQWFWIVLRLSSGFFQAGLLIVIESWLLASSYGDNQNTKGYLLAIYMISYYASLFVGQLILMVINVETIVPFCVVTMLCSLSVIPVSMTRSKTPNHEESSLLSIIKLCKISPSGVLGAFFSGMIVGSVYSLMPAFIVKVGLSIKDTSLIMALIILGAMLGQYPIGRFSDKFDKNNVMIFVCVLIVVTSIGIIISAYTLKEMFMFFAFIFGIVVFVMYPLSISHTCDYIGAKDLVAATGGILLFYSSGAMVGPLLSSLFMDLIGPSGLIVYFILLSSLLIWFISFRRSKRLHVPIDKQEKFIPIPRTTPLASEFDPRLEE